MRSLGQGEEEKRKTDGLAPAVEDDKLTFRFGTHEKLLDSKPAISFSKTRCELLDILLISIP